MAVTSANRNYNKAAVETGLHNLWMTAANDGHVALRSFENNGVSLKQFSTPKNNNV